MFLDVRDAEGAKGCLGVGGFHGVEEGLAGGGVGTAGGGDRRAADGGGIIGTDGDEEVLLVGWMVVS